MAHRLAVTPPPITVALNSMLRNGVPQQCVTAVQVCGTPLLLTLRCA
jgi:hypothetical protein